MRGKYSILLLIEIMLLGAALAQSVDENALNVVINIGVGGTNVAATGVDCFDYYHFGSIVFDFPHTDKFAYSPGETVTVIASVRNTNPYPIVQGNVWAQIFLVNEETGDRQGSYMLDEFLVMEDLYLDVNQSYPISFTWYIPENAPAGEYYVAFFFQEAKAFNLAGLPFINHVYGNIARFEVNAANDKQLFYLDRNSVFLNGKHVILRHFAKTFNPGEEIKYEVNLVNPNEEEISTFVEYELYAWDSSMEENLLEEYSKKEFVDIPANSSKTLSIAFSGLEPAAYLLKIKASANGWTNILNLRFAVKGARGRFIFSGIDKFPLLKGDRFTLFSCFSNTTDWFTDFDGKVMVELKTPDGKLVGRATYEGVITPSIIAIKKELEADDHYDKLYLTSTIMDELGNTHQRITIIYDLSKARSAEIIENFEKAKEEMEEQGKPTPEETVEETPSETPEATPTKPPEEKPTPKPGKSWLEQNMLLVVGAIVIVALIALLLYKRKG